MESPRRALVVEGGGLRAAYSAGVLAEIGRYGGLNHFDTVYGVSAGAMNAAFFAAGQPQTIEDTWRSLDGSKLVQLRHLMRGSKEPVLNLRYLIDRFRTGDAVLNLRQIFQAAIRLVFVLTHLGSYEPVYHEPSEHNIFDAMTASAALPVVHPPVEIEGKPYIDGSLVDNVPVQKALKDGHSKVVVVSNRPKSALTGRFHFGLELYARRIQDQKLADLINRYREKLEVVEAFIAEQQNVHVIRPKAPLPLRTALDTDRERVHTAIDMGIEDAREALRTNIF